MIRQRFDASWDLTAKQPIAEISANAEAIADSVPSAQRGLFAWDNESYGLPVQASTPSFRRRVRRVFQLQHVDLLQFEKYPASQCFELKQQRTVRGSSCVNRAGSAAICIEELRERVQNRACVMFLIWPKFDLVDLASVRFLRDCQDQNIELRNCPPYILEWIRRERLKDNEDAAIRRKFSDR